MKLEIQRKPLCVTTAVPPTLVSHTSFPLHSVYTFPKRESEVPLVNILKLRYCEVRRDVESNNGEKNQQKLDKKLHKHT